MYIANPDFFGDVSVTQVMLKQQYLRLRKYSICGVLLHHDRDSYSNVGESNSQPRKVTAWHQWKLL